MDIGAELTLQIACRVHECGEPPRSFAFWSLLLDVRRATWAEARAVLAAAPKPVLVAPLLEPGGLAVWTLDDLHGTRRADFEHEMANQIAGFTEILKRCELGDDDRIRFEPAVPAFEMSVREFRQWTREYAMYLGISIAKVPGARVGRLVVRPPGGNAPPLGDVRVEGGP